MSVNTKVNGQLVKSAGLYSVSTPIGMADIYSTEEKEVGLWVDNKPLYQRTLTIDTIASTLGVQRFAHNIANIETAFAISGTWLQKSDDSVYIGTKDIIRTDGSGNINVGKGSVGVWVDATNIIIDTTENRSSQYVIVTIQYTKTTDTPWSGKFVPQGYGYVSSGDIYSFEERQVGVWTDGKPLYQKNFATTSASQVNTSTLAVDLSDYDIDNVTIQDGYIKTANNTTPHGGQSFILWYREADKAIYHQVSNSAYLSSPLYVTLQYTKTTDVAGSGEYVPSGDKAEHYTTDEQVIGTYLGDTLYQKTFRILKSDFTNTGTNTYSYSWSLPFDSIVSIDAIMKANNAFVQIPNGTINQNYSNYISSVTTSALGMFMNATNVYANLQYMDITLKYTKTS